MSKHTRGNSYKLLEIKQFVTIMEMHLLLSRHDWQVVAEEHANFFGNKHLTLASIKKKYNNLLQKGSPTGDPNCPDCIRRAKSLHSMTYKKS